MKQKLLLAISVAFLSATVSAQTASWRVHHPSPSASTIDVSHLRVTASPQRTAADTDANVDSVYGTWIRCETIENDDMLTCSNDTLRTPADPSSGNVRMKFSPDTYGCGRLEGDTLTFPTQFASDGAVFDDINSRLVLCGIKADRLTVADNIVFVRNSDGNFQLADSLSGWYIYVEDGDFKHMKWWRAYDTVLRRANATMTAQRTWWFETTNDTVPVSIADDGLLWEVYGWGPGVHISIEVSPEDGKAVVQLPQNVANTAESDWESERGKYVLLCSKKADGTYNQGEIMWDMSEHEVEGTYTSGDDATIVAFPGVTFGTYSLFDSDFMGESMGDYADMAIRRELPATSAIQHGVSRSTGTPDGVAYNLAGQRVGKSYRGLVIEGGVKRIRR